MHIPTEGEHWFRWPT